MDYVHYCEFSSAQMGAGAACLFFAELLVHKTPNKDMHPRRTQVFESRKHAIFGISVHQYASVRKCATNVGVFRFSFTLRIISLQSKASEVYCWTSKIFCSA